MTYYIFNVNPIYKNIVRDYEIFQFFKKLYYKNNIDIEDNISYENVTLKINKKKINSDIKIAFKDNKHYKYENKKHYYYNKYREESFSLTISNSHMLLKGNHNNKILFKAMCKYPFFICNFDSQDYFWSCDYSC